MATQAINRRIVYPITQWQRELVIDVVELLSRKPFDASIERLIAELLRYLPEIQLGSDQYVRFGNWAGQIKKRKPYRPLIEAIREAEDHDSIHAEIMLTRFRAYDRNK